MISSKSVFALLVAACVSLSTPQKAHAANIPAVIAGLAITSTFATGAAYLEYKSVKDETSEKTGKRFCWDMLAGMTSLIFPVSWLCTYKAVEGKDWERRLFQKIGAGVCATTACLAGLVTLGVVVSPK